MLISLMAYFVCSRADHEQHTMKTKQPKLTKRGETDAHLKLPPVLWRSIGRSSNTGWRVYRQPVLYRELSVGKELKKQPHSVGVFLNNLVEIHMCKGSCSVSA